MGMLVSKRQPMEIPNLSGWCGVFFLCSIWMKRTCTGRLRNAVQAKNVEANSETINSNNNVKKY